MRKIDKTADDSRISKMVYVNTSDGKSRKPKVYYRYEQHIINDLDILKRNGWRFSNVKIQGYEEGFWYHPDNANILDEIITFEKMPDGYASVVAPGTPKHYHKRPPSRLAFHTKLERDKVHKTLSNWDTKKMYKYDYAEVDHEKQKLIYDDFKITRSRKNEEMKEFKFKGWVPHVPLKELKFNGWVPNVLLKDGFWYDPNDKSPSIFISIEPLPKEEYEFMTLNDLQMSLLLGLPKKRKTKKNDA